MQRGLLVEYAFRETAGEIVRDTGKAPALDLEMFRATGPGGETWIERLPHGVRFHPSGTLRDQTGNPDTTDTPIIRSPGAATKISQALDETDAFSLEIWFRSSDLVQTGPARIVAYDYTNYELTNLNFMHGGDRCGAGGAQGSLVQIRMGGMENACEALALPDARITGEIQHAVLTQQGRDWVFFLDGELNASGQKPQDQTPADWNDMAGLGLGNLPHTPTPGASHGNHRVWIGDLFYVAWYEVALDEDEVRTNFSVPYQDR